MTMYSLADDWARRLDSIDATQRAGELLVADGYDELGAEYRQKAADLEGADEAVARLVDCATGAIAQSGSARYRGTDLVGRLINLGWTPPADLLPILDVREG